jgi:uncharacterized protein (TIGR03437 family)
VVHQDFSALVSSQSPARDGEIVHLYATGLGPVDPPVSSGAAALDRLAKITTPWAFRWSVPSPEEAPADVLFAGLAPGMVGLYQMDVRVPASESGSAILLAKHPTGYESLFANFPVIAAGSQSDAREPSVRTATSQTR